MDDIQGSKGKAGLMNLMKYLLVHANFIQVIRGLVDRRLGLLEAQLSKTGLTFSSEMLTVS